MAQAPTDTQQAQATEPMLLAETQPQGMPVQEAQPMVFSQETMEGAAQDARMKFMTSVLERHLSNSELEFEHVHEKMSPMTNDHEAMKGIMIAVTPKDPAMTSDDVIASIQQTLGQIPIVQEQYNGLSSSVSKTALERKITEAAKADDSSKLTQLLEEYGAMPQIAPGGKRFGIDFPVGNNKTYHIRLEGIALDDLIKSLMEASAAMPAQPADADQDMMVKDVQKPEASTAPAAQTVNPEMVTKQEIPETEKKWASKEKSPAASAAKAVEDARAVAAMANQSNTR